MFSSRQCPSLHELGLSQHLVRAIRSLYDNTGSLEKRRWLTRPVRQYRTTLGAKGSDAFAGESLTESSFDGQLENVEPEGHLHRLAAVSAGLGPPRHFELGVHLGWLRGLLQQTRCREEWDLACGRQVHHMIRADRDDHGLHAVARLRLLAWVGQPRGLLSICPKDRSLVGHATALSIPPASIACAPWRSRLFSEDRGGDPAICFSCIVLRVQGVGLPLGPPV